MRGRRGGCWRSRWSLRGSTGRALPRPAGWTGRRCVTGSLRLEKTVQEDMGRHLGAHGLGQQAVQSVHGVAETEHAELLRCPVDVELHARRGHRAPPRVGALIAQPPPVGRRDRASGAGRCSQRSPPAGAPSGRAASGPDQGGILALVVGKSAHEISPVALEAVGRIDALFDIERGLTGLPAEARLERLPSVVNLKGIPNAARV
jgi:hypothetical protein